MIKTSKTYLQPEDIQAAEDKIAILGKIDNIIDLAILEASSDRKIKKFLGTSKIKDTSDNREILSQLSILSMNSHKQMAIELMKKAYKHITHELSELRDNDKYADSDERRKLIELYSRAELYLYKQMAYLFNQSLFNVITIQ